VLTPAASVVLTCRTQDEIDHYWAALTDGGEESRCGWLVDRFGLSWQIVPEGLGDLLSGGGEADRAARVTAALLAMNKLDLPALQAAYDAD
jgi:predicted 3-demethylubiquinone-9 3-methyltransferase (glyoxalase superfamily)